MLIICACTKMDNPSVSYGLSWRDESFLPNLNARTALYYFCQLSNPFYDKTSNNEIVKMQKLDYSTLKSMVGVEYDLIINQEPTLYVICKQVRSNPSTVTPLAYYYMVNGTVYQCPDSYMVIRNKMTTSLYYLDKGFKHAIEYMELKQSLQSNVKQQKQEEPGGVSLAMGNVLTSIFREFSDV